MADLIDRQALMLALKRHGVNTLMNGSTVMDRLKGYNPTSALTGYELCLRDVSEILAGFTTIEAEPLNPWVNVAHEKPPCRGNYFIAYKFQGSDMRFFGEAFWHDDIPTNGYVNGDHFSNEGVDGMYVTHWMRIPKLPNCGAKMDLEG